MELAAWLLTFATAAAVLYAVTRALAVAFRIAVAVLAIAAIGVGVQAYGRGERWEKIAAHFSGKAKSAQHAVTSAWDQVRPWWNSATDSRDRKPSRH